MKRSLLLVVLCSLFCLSINAQYNKIVAKDGIGDYSTVQAAIDAAPANNATPWVVLIKNGKYYEKINIPSNKPNIQLIGESVANVLVYYDDYAGKPITGGGTLGTQNSASVTINATDFVAVNITFANTFNYDSAAAAGVSGSQAVAVVINADRAAFKNCRFIGMQDTLYTKGSGNPRHYFYKCYIDGIVDFIFGSSIDVFDSCVIYPKARTGTGSSYITAANTTVGQAYGYVFRDCKIPANTGATVYYLGRPWNNATSGVTAENKVVFLNTSMSNTVNPLGWSIWDAGTITSAITFAEYKSKKNDGSLVDVSNRVAWSKQFSNTDTVGYNLNNMFSGWNPCSVRADFCTSPTTEIVVSNFKGIKSGGNANFSWNISWAMTGITYELYKSTNNKVSFNILSSTTSINDTAINFSGTDVLPPPGASYFYFVKASKVGSTTSYTDTIEISSIPTIITSATSLTNFLQGSTTPSAAQSYIVSGTNLLNNILIAAPANYEISIDNSTWNVNPITLTQTAGTVANTIVYVRLNAPSPSNYSGTIIHSTVGVSTTHTKDVSVSGVAQSMPLQVYGVIQQWDLTANNLDNPTILIDPVAAPTTPTFGKLYLSNGTQVPAIPAYSTQFGQAFGPTANGDGTWSTSAGGPGGSLNRAYYEEFTVKPISSIIMLLVDSIIVNTAFYNTSSNIKFAVAYSKSNFTLDSSNVTGGRDGAGLTLAGTANGAFATPIVLANQTSGPTAQYALALNAGSGVMLAPNDSLKIRLYYSCGSGNPGRYAMLKNVQIKGDFGVLPVKLTSYQVSLTKEKQVANHWITATEINTSHFNVQRSLDGRSFVTVGKVNAKGVSTYGFVDPLILNHLPDNIYYRLEIVDKDGSKQYSEIKQVTINDKQQVINIYPNPATRIVTVSCKNAKQVNIIDGLGRIVYHSLFNNELSKNIDLSSIIKGMYLVEIITNKGENIREKLLVE